MENETKYSKDGMFIHNGDHLNIIFEEHLFNDLETNKVSAANYAWEVYTYCKEDLLIYGNAVNIPLGSKSTFLIFMTHMRAKQMMSIY